MTAVAEPRHQQEQSSRLTELLACEKELADLMVGVREEARRQVEAARAEAEQAAAELGATLVEAGERVRRAIDDAARERVDTTLADARAQAARFDGVSDEEVARLAASALRLLMGHA